MNVLIVESPTKGKAIAQYLGKDFRVLSSFGHVRALPNKKGSVDVTESFEMLYKLTDTGETVVPQLIKDVKKATALYLATDPDREGEAISWHLVEVFKENDVLPKDVHRVVFHEITKTAVQNAIASPRKIDENLVRAQRLRQALDYLVGFSISPVLWKKLPGSKSAGRVQSVALRILCDRENEIGLFTPEEYWTVTVNMTDGEALVLPTQLSHMNGEKLERMSIRRAEEAEKIVEEISGLPFLVEEIKKKELKQKPSPPFITSTMQQTASTILGFSVKKTMSLAQKLYEGIEIGGVIEGLITYMRTDATHLSVESVDAIREFIQEKFGQEYLPASPVLFKKKVKNAQEAHEAIRPTSIFRTPEEIESYLTPDQYKLYRLIWERALACQMSDAITSSQNIVFVSQDKKFKTSASASLLIFDGFNAAFSHGKNKNKNQDVIDFIKKHKEGAQVKVGDVLLTQNFTEPPHRYSEAGLVKHLEELGIGRPSTYATVVSVLQERGYASIVNKSFIPESRGRLVSEFLVHFFSKYVEYHFTAELEDRLDKVADGTIFWLDVIQDFWDSFHSNVEEVEKVPITEVLAFVNGALARQKLVSAEVKVGDKCPKCEKGYMHLNVSRYGVFLGCTDYPVCRFIVNSYSTDNDTEYPKQIAQDISLHKGPYGIYLKCKGKNSSIPKDVDPVSIDEEFAHKIASLPKILGKHPIDGKEIKMGLGPYGLYLFWNAKYYNLQFSQMDEMTLDQAVQFMEDYVSHDKSLLRVLGSHEGEEIQIRDGRYGPYIKYSKMNVPIPKGESPESLSLETAILLIEKKKNTSKSARKVTTKRKVFTKEKK
ncbi:type I DNA topoisomerase [Neorickettsia sennetsu]|uniref:DNA topoisomerase 1 n=1 Tax=Ehrlichia sennetsu (strain ATCC VR-367 / Miyayama) TaxID=222891 RepID=Q2GDH2_EHRS3|nr:type I DNA topoisomerase [Neorickettsia sennetsu]ABD46336.1 DNA topoisomerase I [Neorickettsia sennetsu str. Miyayama]